MPPIPIGEHKTPLQRVNLFCMKRKKDMVLLLCFGLLDDKTEKKMMMKCKTGDGRD